MERGPDAPAIVDGDLELFYAQWLTRIQGMATGLLDLGLRPGERLFAILQSRWETATLRQACQFIGIVVIPLNWRVKSDEFGYCVCDVDTKTPIFGPVGVDAILGSPVTMKILRIALDGASHSSLPFGTLLDAAPRPGNVLPEAGDVSLMLYTSGTTGRPKGASCHRKQECTATLAHVVQNLYRRGERTLGVIPLYHTIGVRSLPAMTLVGGLFVYVRCWNPSQALQMVADYRMSRLYLVPTLYHDLLADPGFDALRVCSVTKLGFAGTATNDGPLKRLEQTFHPKLFANHYDSSKIYTFSVEQRATGKPGSAGRAGFNTRLRLTRLDINSPDAVVTPGEEGQIIAELHGDEILEGYWDRDDTNAKSLRQDWYFAGDTGYFDAEGDLFVSGRVDDTITSGSENISPTDIEPVLSLYPAVGEVAVAGLPDPRQDRKVVTFIKLRDDVDTSALGARYRDSELANFKYPRGYVFIADTPKSPVGKTLRRELSEGKYTALPSLPSRDLSKKQPHEYNPDLYIGPS